MAVNISQISIIDPGVVISLVEPTTRKDGSVLVGRSATYLGDRWFIPEEKSDRSYYWSGSKWISNGGLVRGTSFPTLAKEGDRFFHETLLWDFEYRVFNGVLQWGHRKETDTSTGIYLPIPEGFNAWLQKGCVTVQTTTPPYDNINYRTIYIAARNKDSGITISFATNGVGVYETTAPTELEGNVDGFNGTHCLEPILVDPRLGDAATIQISTKTFGSPGSHSFSLHTTFWFVPQ